ncbi:MULTISPECIES: dihydroorotate dehydrogenase electron transfer subunit [unclassified Symbiopectobacterium]|uniref:dihydroorotate dehydrogenase electron transfer subunit n=1 Tax=unclassified Symbiopectobacterium TaxID=2794573 RepID=UPI002227A4A8|nr:MULTISPECIES: dihydroorotate dehydrogenase electron transfer subunit [unclassified Symbiopectobacterium]MCW2475719.1 dihydroorotate dehydrogenase electron transfer subunit [Candidatus Symbiopectobacterium sp. NZEC151]MCW2486098.1 dihydroorotate dehydrogenase electron transfer subunit [Candidatus Symbiopectobacterium sp. NZEC127]
MTMRDDAARACSRRGSTARENAASVLSNEWVNDEYKHLRVRVDALAAQVKPGQFFNLQCPQTEQDKPFFRRPMSTWFANAEQGYVDFLYKVVGAGTRGLSTLRPQDAVNVLGPLGNGFTLQPGHRHILVAGRGVGLATLAPLAEHAAAHHVQVTALLSARDPEHLMSQQRFLASGATVIEVTDSDGSSAMAQVEQRIRAVHQQRPIDAVYTCGSSRVIHLLQRLSQELGFSGEAALEQQMACGLGMCYCCVRPMRDKESHALSDKRVCYDGPVFPLHEVVL